MDGLYTNAIELLRQAKNTPSQTRNEVLIESQRMFEECANLVERLDLFSLNETVEDVSTENLKYLLIPAYLAEIICQSSLSPSCRLESFKKAKSYAERFFDKIVLLGLAPESLSKIVDQDITKVAPVDSLKSAMCARDAKVAKFRRMQQLEEELKCKEEVIKTNKNIDEETKRNYYLMLIQKKIDDTLESLEREIKPAIYFESSVKSGNIDLNADRHTSDKQSSVVRKPITIVKDELQKHVFGLGYPSKPTVTVDEFITKKIDDGDLAFHAHKEVYSNSLQKYAEQPTLIRDQEEAEKADREYLDEREDSTELERKRAWDEFRDNNPRGSGNRHNQG